MKLVLICALMAFTSCTKEVPEKALTLTDFQAFLSGKHFGVSAYYNNDGSLPYPENTTDDVFSFGQDLGEINSLEPCRITYVPYSIYEEGGAVKMDWVNLNVSYETFVVKEVDPNYFVLQGAEHSIKYAVTR